MKRLITLAFVICLVVPMTGCFHNQIITQKDYNASATAPDQESGFQMYLIAGLIPLGAEVQLDTVCPNAGAGLVEVEQTFLNGILNYLVGSLVSFQTTRVYCATGAASAEPAEAPAEPAAGSTAESTAAEGAEAAAEGAEDAAEGAEAAAEGAEAAAEGAEEAAEGGDEAASE